MPMWRTGDSTRVMPWRSASLRILSNFLPPPWTSSGAPYSRQTPSTYSMSSVRRSLPTKRSSQPPTSGVRVSLPSLKAPAPPQPQVMSQGSQPEHTPLLRAGQARREMSGPRSTTSTLAPLRRTSSSAAKIPAGPAPTTITS